MVARRELRRCILKHKPDDPTICGEFTRRVYLMVPDTTVFVPFFAGLLSFGFGRGYHWYVLDVCGKDDVCIVKEGRKWFSIYKLVWRRFFDSSQFKKQDELRNKARSAFPPIGDVMEQSMRRTHERAQKLFQNAQTVTTTTPMPQPPPAPVASRPTNLRPRLSLWVGPDRCLSLGHLPRRDNKVKD